MTHSTHTPGPWSYEEAGDMTTSNTGTFYISKQGHVIGRTVTAKYNRLPRAEVEANARLIAAAPVQNAALIKAERELSRIYDEAGTGADTDPLIIEIRAAIAKAKGE